MSNVLYMQRGQIGIITMNREAALNALNTETLHQLEAVLDGVDFGEVRCIILTGAGEKSFVAGADVVEMSGFDTQQALDFSGFGNHVFRKIETLAVPVIAAVNGFALGGGCELAMSCDIRLAAENAVFGQPETGLGVTPGFGGTQRLPRIVGMERAKELIFTGRKVKAPEALQLGLVSAVYTQTELMDKAIELADRICANVPFAVRASKAAMNEGAQVGIDEALGIEAERFSTCFVTQDRQEAMLAFVEKRKPAPFANK